MKHALAFFRTKFSPVAQLLFIAAFVRLIAAIFSKGFGWHDDHFLIIESSQSWADGSDYNYWLPDEHDPGRVPQGHSLFYPGIHYLIFCFLKMVGLHDPQAKMFVVRLLHAAWSLLIVAYGYRIAKQYSTESVAWYTGLFLALFWFMPFISVRNLVEFVCVPPILISIYLLGKQQRNIRQYLLAGLWIGVAFSIRFQAVFLCAGMIVAMVLMRHSLKGMIIALGGFIFAIFLTQGVVDYMIWKKPFAEFLSYVQYNIENAGAYSNSNWHMYFDLIGGLLVPPLSILLFTGWMLNAKRIPLLFWPTLIYLLFHTYFPNRQERFVMTIMPFIIISGTQGLFEFLPLLKKQFPRRLLNAGWIFVIAVNMILLCFLTVSYSKRHRVEAMYYLYKKGEPNRFFIEDSNKEQDFLMPPLFYYGRWMYVCGITKKFTADSAYNYYHKLPQADRPTYIVFWQAENIGARVDSLKKRFPALHYETTIQPSLIDKTLYWLNPLNDNQTSFIYKVD
jgi:hypothetical protein